MYINKTSTNILIPNDILSECDYVSCVSCCVDYFYEFTVDDIITLVEGEQISKFLMYNRNYKTIYDFIDDLNNILKSISPNKLNYTCTINNITDNLTITVIDSMSKSLQLNNEKLQKLFGMDQINSFTSLLIGFKPVIINPIKQIYLCSDVVRSFNQNDLINNVISSYQVEKMGETLRFNILDNISHVGKSNSVNIWLIDQYGKKINNYGDIYVEIIFFKLENLDNIHDSNDIQNAINLKLIKNN
jgi:predicted transcriptional regulator